MRKILVLAVLICSCSDRPADHPGETILARVGNRTISVNEFIRRAEYTIRPPYCSGDNYIHRKIALNSLIAEKLLALEADKTDWLGSNAEFQDYLIGRKEQAMRQWLYYKEAYEKAQVDTTAIKKVYSVAGRTYRIAYFTLEDSARQAAAQQMLQEGIPFEAVCRRVSGGLDPPEREVAFQGHEHEALIEALFSEKLRKDQVIAPVELDDGRMVFSKILGWTDRKLLSDLDIRRRWEESRAYLKAKKALDLYDAYVAEVMRGKRIEFMPQTFRALVNQVGPLYLRSEEEKKEAFNAAMWGKSQGEMTPEILGNELDALQDQPLFRVDGQVWLVRDFERELRRHPLLFRKRRFPKAEFAEQFKLAIVDMVRDRYLTEEAYKKGYDKVNVVERDAMMWRDNLAALVQQQRILKQQGQLDAYRQDPLPVIEQVLDPYLAELKKAYNDQIEINTDVFERIKLTRVDMMVLRRNVPFPILVPGFPMLTTAHRLDYGRKMQTKPGR